MFLNFLLCSLNNNELNFSRLTAILHIKVVKSFTYLFQKLLHNQLALSTSSSCLFYLKSSTADLCVKLLYFDCRSDKR